MTKKNLVILTSGNGSNLQAILDKIDAGNISGEVNAVISNKNSHSLVRAKNHQIPAYFLPHTKFNSRETYDQALVDIITPYQPDFIILAGFMRILTPTFIHSFKDKIINIHPSLLPKYKGLHTHKQALENNDKEHGTTVHVVNEALDSGAIIDQAKFDIEPSDTIEALETKIKVLEHQLYPRVIQKLCSEDILIRDGIVIFN
ncbi:phosphoribosylglycinamide formyltransferase [Thiotrichales bacterium 19S11-10]|nr:phosphoribosylglycinamide formyltransferase [Thiotrichales bacterium 19S11-10]